MEERNRQSAETANHTTPVDDTAKGPDPKAALTRIQRALGLKCLPDGDGGSMCKVEDPFDPRRLSTFPFERNVVFVEIEVDMRRNKAGAITWITAGIARLDTEKLCRLPAGRNGEYYKEEIQVTSLQAGNEDLESSALSEYEIGPIRKGIAHAFEAAGAIGPAVLASDLLMEERNIVMVSWDATDLLKDLSEIGFDAKEHAAVIDIISIETEIYDSLAPSIRSVADFECLLAEVGNTSSDAEDDSAHIAKCTLAFVIRWAIMDIQEEVTAKVKRTRGNGGTFRGPFLKMETEEQGLAYQLRRVLALSWNDSAQQLQRCTQYLLGKALLAKPAQVTRTDLTREEDRETQEPPPTVLPKLEPGREASPRAHTPPHDRKDTTPRKPENDDSTEGGRFVTEQADVSAHDILKRALRTIKKETPSAQSNVDSQNSVATSDTSSNEDDRIYKPSRIDRALFDYHRHQEAFDSAVLTAVELYQKTDGYFEVEEYKGKARNKVSPMESYLALARILGEHPNSITLTMLDDLARVVVMRDVVNEWYRKLPEDDHRKDVEDIQRHKAILRFLLPTYDMLHNATVKGKKKEASEQLAQRVEALVRATRAEYSKGS